MDTVRIYAEMTLAMSGKDIFIDELMEIGKARLGDRFREQEARTMAEYFWSQHFQDTARRLYGFILDCTPETQGELAYTRMEQALRHLARKTASYNQEVEKTLLPIPDPADSYTGKPRRELEEILDSAHILLEFIDRKVPVVKIDRIPLHIEIQHLDRRRNELARTLAQKLGACATLILGDNILHSANLGACATLIFGDDIPANLDFKDGENSDYFCFRSVNRIRKKNNIPLEFRIRREDGRVTAIFHEGDKLKEGFMCKTDVTDVLDDPKAMAKKILKTRDEIKASLSEETRPAAMKM